MATKKAAKKEVTKTTRARVQVVAITPEQFLAAINRFGQVCEFVERRMRDDHTSPDSAAYATGAGQQLKAPAPVPTVEDLVLALRGTAEEVAHLCTAVRDRLWSSGNAAGGKAVNLDAANSPSQGVIKDSVMSAHDLLYAIRRDLYSISEYVATV